MKDRRKGERRSFTWENTYPNHTFYGERRKTIIKAGRRMGAKDRRSEDNRFVYFCHKERRKK